MSTFHSTVSRRDFMKGLGLVSAGAMGAMAAAPAFHDLDEVLASGSGNRKRAWWIKEVDEPTVEMDLSIVQRVHGGHSTQSAPVVARYVGKDKYNAMTTPDSDKPATHLKNNDPGYRLRDQALNSANGGTFSNISLAGVTGAVGGVIPTCEADKFGRMKVQTPEQRGVPKWTGTPEEATAMLRAAMVFFGAMDFGTEEMNKKLIGLSGNNSTMTYYPDIDKCPTTVLQPIEFANQPKFSWDAVKNITYIPDNIRLSTIGYLIPHDLELNRVRPTTLGATAQTRYRMRRETTTCTQDFITGIGYQSMSDVPYRAMPSGATGVLTGLTENARHSIMTISPTYGAFVGIFDMLTDLELAPTKPINAGIWKFCQSCGLCADKCPSGSIMKKDQGDPSFEVRPSLTTPADPALPGMRASGEWHKLGRKTFWTDMPTCQLYVRSVAVCNRCWGNCVFNGANGAMVHQVVKATAGTTPLFNSFFATLHDSFGYNLKTGESIEEWWDMSRPSYGFNSALFATHTSYG
jgi:epoxyqueuosine reductase